MNYHGSCHCGRIAFDLEGDIDQVYECNCSLCSRRGYLLWFGARDQLKLKTAPENLATYTFNTHKIRHHFCPNCGCAPFGEGSKPDGTASVAVNVRCIEGLKPSSLKINAVDGASR